MKKDFPLTDPAKAAARVLEGVKHEVRRYVQRERRKPVPEGFDLWDFRCKAGPDRDHASECELGSLAPAIDVVARSGALSVYVEILAVPGKRILSSETPSDRIG